MCEIELATLGRLPVTSGSCSVTLTHPCKSLIFNNSEQSPFALLLVLPPFLRHPFLVSFSPTLTLVFGPVSNVLKGTTADSAAYLWSLTQFKINCQAQVQS